MCHPCLLHCNRIHDLLVHGCPLHHRRVICGLPLCHGVVADDATTDGMGRGMVTTASFSAVVLETTVVSSVTLDPPGVVADDPATDGMGRGMVTAAGACCAGDGGPPLGHPSLRISLLLYRGWSSSDDTSSSLRTGVATLPHPRRLV
jgi:hypothetical protein